MLKKIISYFTFPGIMFHQLSHKIACHLFEVRIIKINYFDRDGDGYIMYEIPSRFSAVFFVSLAPLFLNSATALALGLIIGVVPESSFIVLPLLWLAISIGYYSIPDMNEGNNVRVAARRAIEENTANPFHYLAFPFYWLIVTVNALRFLFVDLLWSASFTGLGIVLARNLLN